MGILFIYSMRMFADRLFNISCSTVNLDLSKYPAIIIIMVAEIVIIISPSTCVAGLV